MNFDPWHFQQFVGVLVALIALIFAMGKHPARFVLGYFLVHAIVFGFPQLNNTQMSIDDLVTNWLCLRLFCTILVLVFFVRALNIYGEKFFLRVVYVVLTLDAFWQLFDGPGIFVGTTHDPVVMAAFLPLLIRDRYFIYAIPIWVLNILKMFGSTSLLILGFQCLAFVLIFWKGAVYRVASVVLLGWGASIVYLNPNFGGSRWATIWREHVQFWVKQESYFFGLGPGSFEWFSIVVDNHAESNKFWLHSDWLQFIFEFGFVGGLILFAFYLFILKNLFQKSDLVPFCAWLGLGFGMVFYSPIQFFMVQFVAAVLIKRGLSEDFRID